MVCVEMVNLSEINCKLRSSLSWLDPVFLYVHFPSLNLSYLKKIDLYCEKIITNVLHIDSTL